LGLSPAFTLGTDMMIGAAPPEQAGAAAALSETGSELGGALGIAILGSLGTAVYRRALDAQLPAGVPSAAADAARATLGAARSVATGLPGDLGVELLDAARAAFTQAMAATAVICAGVAIATALLTAGLLRRA